MWGRYHPELGLAAFALGLVALAFDVVVDRTAARGVGADRVRAEPAGPRPAGHPLGGAAWPLALVSLAGVWAAVPDTEAPLVIGAALTPVALYRWRSARAPSPAATVALVAAVGVAAVGGAAGRPGAAMTWCAVGAVLVAPALLGFRRWWPTGTGALPVSATHTVVALAGCRFLMERSGAAVSILAALYLGAVAVAVRCARAGTVAR